MSRYNDAELSKMDMGPLWAEIMESQEPFSLFSGHDSTVFPLMASLGEKVWNATDFPAYASMMIIEVCTQKIVNRQHKQCRIGKKSLSQ